MSEFWEYVRDIIDQGELVSDDPKLKFELSTEEFDLYGTNKPPLTLGELYKMYRTDGYVAENKRKTMLLVSQKGKRYVMKKPRWYLVEKSSLLYRHIIAEQLWENDCSKIDLNSEQYENPFVLLELLRLWLNPLSWVKPTILEKVVVNGTSAIEKFHEERVDAVNEIYNYISLHFLLEFADKPKVCKENDLEDGAFSGIHDWSIIARGESYYVQSLLEQETFTQSELSKMEPYNAIDLRKNLILIAKHRGGKRAAELLRMLQSEWPTIKSFKINLTNMDKESIQQFEYALYNAFNDLLVAWGEMPNLPHRNADIYQVNGDLVSGNKYTGTVVKNVENGGIGVQENH